MNAHHIACTDCRHVQYTTAELWSPYPGLGYAPPTVTSTLSSMFIKYTTFKPITRVHYSGLGYASLSRAHT